VPGQAQFDNATSRELEAAYTSPIAKARRQKALALLDLNAGDEVLDIGSGPGYLTDEIALQVGSSGRVLGIDRSPDMLALSRRRCAERAQVSFQQADAAKISSPSAAFDAAAAIQIYEYVADMDNALQELYRLLRPGGRAVIVDTDWASLVWEAEDRVLAERIFNAWEEHLADPHLPRRLAPLLRRAGFEIVTVDPYAAVVLAPEPFVAGIAKLIAGFVPGRRGITAEDAAAWLADLARTASSGRYFFSVTAFLFLAKRPGN